jgi:glycerate 2-kinase
MIKIRNKNQLIENAETLLLKRARIITLNCIEEALNAADPRRLLKSRVVLEGSCLRVNGISFDLKSFGNIYVVGGGKAGSSMAVTLEELLGQYLTAGIVNIPRGTCQKTKKIELNEAGHPTPDQAGLKGALKMLAIAEKAKENDLIICLLSGGGSSLMPLPRENITLKDKKELTKALLKSGAAISEINIVRKHLSAFKGGWLAKKAYPATILNLVLSDVTGDKLDTIASGPTVPDPSTFADAQNILKSYRLLKDDTSRVSKVLSDGVKGLIPETPKPDDAVFKKVTNVIIGNNNIAAGALCECLKAEGLNTLLISDALIGEARNVGQAFSQFAYEIAVLGKPLPKPIGIIAGGETTVIVVGKGSGGRNQELALSAAIHLKEVEGCVIASIGTDGVDGPTDAAGAIADSSTLKRAFSKGIDPRTFLKNNDSYNFFSQLGDLIFTGPTGSNVNDISIIVVL